MYIYCTCTVHAEKNKLPVHEVITLILPYILVICEVKQNFWQLQADTGFLFISGLRPSWRRSHLASATVTCGASASLASSNLNNKHSHFTRTATRWYFNFISSHFSILLEYNSVCNFSVRRFSRWRAARAATDPVSRRSRNGAIVARVFASWRSNATIARPQAPPAHSAARYKHVDGRKASHALREVTSFRTSLI